MWLFSQAQHIGSRKEQQDRLAILPLAGADEHLLVLADGMGGHLDGARAAEQVLAVAEKGRHFAHTDDPPQFLRGLCHAAHSRILALGGAREHSPGSTCLFLLLRGSEAYWAHIGDSRLYHMRQGSMLSRTRDHSVFELMAAKGTDVAPPDATRNQLYRRLGGSEVPSPDCDGLLAEHGDVFLLCSDGFWSELQTNELLNCARSGQRLESDCAEILLETALSRSGPRGDNLTAIIAQWQESSAVKRPRFFALRA